MNLYMDIETGPCSETLERVPFDPSTVALGNFKDEEKIKAKIEKAKIEHTAKAALVHETARVLVIGFKDDNGVTMLAYQHEEELLTEAWRTIEQHLMAQQDLVGFNIKGYDLPVLVQRSRIHRIQIPKILYRIPAYDPWHSKVKDLQDYWQMGDRHKRGGLDYIARVFGVGQKTKGISGADFARLYHGTEQEREQALHYLRNDLNLTEAVANVLL